MKSYHKYLLNNIGSDRETLTELLTTKDTELRNAIFGEAELVRNLNVGNYFYFRGLIEFSNKCVRDCLYCGIRANCKSVYRYEMTEEEVLNAVDFAWKHNLGSVVIQSGERNDKEFILKIARILNLIRKRTNDEIKVTLSCGEQTEETFRYWLESGASRYLLRIETTNSNLFRKIHPCDGKHLFSTRLQALENLKKTGYQTGTGVMIGLPGQSIEMLASDLAFFKNFNVDMVGMGPYLEHNESPMTSSSEQKYNPSERLELSLRMIALLRLLMKNINIAASTALQSIDPEARVEALKCGANVIMPNITPLKYRYYYQLYENKPGMNIDGAENIAYWNTQMQKAGGFPAFKLSGDPKHFLLRKQRTQIALQD